MSEQNTTTLKPNRVMDIMALAASLQEQEQERVYTFIMGAMELGRLNQEQAQKTTA